MRTLALLIALVTGCSGSDVTSASQGASVPADWVPVTASCGYAFMAPPDIVPEEVQGIDSCVDQWTTDSCTLGGDFGAFSGPEVETEELLDFRQFTEAIDGRTAQITTMRIEAVPGERPFLSSVYFEDVGHNEPDSLFEVTVKVFARCSTAADRDETLLLFRTIMIPDPPTE